jgi:membrane-associated phospholipid phosphatase
VLLLPNSLQVKFKLRGSPSPRRSLTLSAPSYDPSSRSVMSSRRLCQVIFVLGILSAATISVMVSCHRGLWTVDLPVARWVTRHSSMRLSAAARVLTQLGSTPGVIAVAILVAVAEYRRGLGNTVVLYLFVSIAGQAALVNLAKATLGRDRPNLAPLVPTASSSFPSGHTTAAATAFLCFALLLGRGRSTEAQTAFLVFAAVIAGTVAATRVLLGGSLDNRCFGGDRLGVGIFSACHPSVRGAARSVRPKLSTVKTKALSEFTIWSLLLLISGLGLRTVC